MKKTNTLLGIAVLLAHGSAIGAAYVPILDPIAPIAPTHTLPAGPERHPGKEYSHELDRSSTDGNVSIDSQQVTLWDGSGGVADGYDYNDLGGGGDPDFNRDPDAQVDAISNRADILFGNLTENEAPILYSLRTTGAQGTGNDVGSPVKYETTGGATGTWATWAQVDENAGDNLDGLEVWGPEGSPDADSFSLYNDSGSGCSVYAWGGAAQGANCYITHGELVSAVLPFLVGQGLLITDEDLIDVDAMVLNDAVGAYDNWDDGDSILFSLWPLLDPTNGVAMVGDNAILWRRSVGVSWLNHGGHLWSDGWLGENVDALEAASGVPTSSTLALLLLGLAGLRRTNSVQQA